VLPARRREVVVGTVVPQDGFLSVVDPVCRDVAGVRGSFPMDSDLAVTQLRTDAGHVRGNRCKGREGKHENANEEQQAYSEASHWVCEYSLHYTKKNHLPQSA